MQFYIEFEQKFEESFRDFNFRIIFISFSYKFFKFFFSIHTIVLEWYI